MPATDQQQTQRADGGTPVPGRWKALTVCVLAGVMIFVDVSIVNVALPSFRTGLGAGPADLSWIVAGYTLTFGLALVPGGRLGETAQRIGSSIGIALVATVFFAVLAASGEQFGVALGAGLAVVLLCVLAAFALGLVDVLRRRRARVPVTERSPDRNTAVPTASRRS